MKTLFLFPLILLSYSFINMNDSGAKKQIVKNELRIALFKNDLFSYDDCITASLENIAGDTYAMKFYNKCDSGYKVYYRVVDRGRIIQETSTVYVKGNSGNSSGTIHCSDEAEIRIIKKESF